MNLDRRQFISRSTALGLAAIAAACGDSDGAPTTTSTESTTTTTSPTSTTSTSTTTTTVAASEPYTSPGWLAAENARPGTTAWRIDSDVPGASSKIPAGWIEGYADTTSARPGQTVTLFVSTDAESWHAEAYRMGWYGGDLGRLVWTSDEIEKRWQFNPDVDPSDTTKMRVADWGPSLAVEIDDEWPPGSYLVKLVASSGEAHYVPLTIRRDSAVGGLVVVSAVTTWQAYNPWGGCSLYQCFDGPGRSTVVSFDRPYARTYNWGSADFLTHELPLIALIEELGLDTAYVTDIDLHTSGLGENDIRDSVFSNRTALLTTGHDEYYSTAMRDTLGRARDAGVNLAFFGANAVYRHVRLEPNADGVPYRQMPNYRTAASDPLTDTDPEQSTVQWRNPPLNRPESSLIGVQYFAAGVTAALRVVNPSNWVFDDVTVRNGSSFKKLVSIEADGLGPASVEPENLEVLASGPVKYKDSEYDHAMTYYSTDSGAGVFATGTIAWINALDAEYWGDEDATEFVRGVTSRVLRVFAEGPSGDTYPSEGNADRYRRPTRPLDDE
ncbi:MAG: hypothetical protein RLZ86_279 [Actinomycetota bacterium]